MSDEAKARVFMRKVRRILHLDRLPKPTRKVVVGVLGGLVLVAGIVMLFVPGPAFVVIPLGLLLLATEFPWAEKAAKRVMTWLRQARVAWRRWRKQRHAPST